MDHLYMFAIMSPTGLTARINHEREIFAEKYKCTKALKPPVHITLYNPFKTPDIVEERINEINGWVERQTPFTVSLKNYNFFRNPISPVVYIDVVKNEVLESFHYAFVEQLKKYIPVSKDNKRYAPHFTIGYRDISPSIFPGIVREYSTRSFEGSFEVNSIYLWKHNGTNWQIQNELKFEGETGGARYPKQGELF